ncbi:MAG: cyclopropane-fatty-acyl-phospholipid synthase family protein [Acidobacteriota bacterium]|nr:cyclopropane-fatty-acyl-phospholipid synthase family protein [Acidobacteriota bacterium]
MNWAIDLAERRIVPDPLVRAGMRLVLGQRLRSERAPDGEGEQRKLQTFVSRMRAAPIAVATDTANQQHYELPAEFFQTVLGPFLKYSSCLWPNGVNTLAEAEERMLAVSCERAGIADGMEILDLGCGWGSMSLWIARHFPACRILAVSNSRIQAQFIRQRCAELGTDRVEVVTADMNDFATERRFDRVVSVEMFEHMLNWERLFARVESWLRPRGAFFLHVFCHRRYAYRYTDSGASDWMARHFFTGGIMPSEELPRSYDADLEVEDQWRVNGLHYSRTLEAWLETMDGNREALMPLFRATYGEDAARWFARWRMFFMACSELFRYHGGDEWFVTHTLLRPRAVASG